jgi:hypothetical protein
MDKLKSIILARKHAAPADKAPTSLADAETSKKTQYMEKAKIWKTEEESVLKKRAADIDEFYANPTIKQLKKDGSDFYLKNPLDVPDPVKTNSSGTVVFRDVALRNTQDVDLELTQEQIKILDERSAEFKKREDENAPNQRRKVDMGLNVAYPEKCQDVYWWMQKMIRDWNHDNESKPRGFSETNEGRKNSEVYRETKRHLMNLYEL